jgi:hypothetical protein
MCTQYNVIPWEREPETGWEGRYAEGSERHCGLHTTAFTVFPIYCYMRMCDTLPSKWAHERRSVSQTGMETIPVYLWIGLWSLTSILEWFSLSLSLSLFCSFYKIAILYAKRNQRKTSKII